MRVCYFGIYNPNYSRNKILISGLRVNGVEVIECNTTLVGFKKYLDLIRKHWRLRNDYEVMVIGFPGQQLVLLAKLLSRKPVILDAYLSLYDSLVYDRQQYSSRSLKAKYLWLIEWLACQLADKVLLDTNIHIQYFVETFKVSSKKFWRIFIGADDKIFYPRPQLKEVKEFLLHFHGTYIPLQGVSYIIEAANILRKEKVIFQLVGNGQEYNKVKKLVKDLALEKVVRLIDYQLPEKLAEYVSQANLCLGIFGDTAKAKRVIPNKVYEYLAMKKPVITGDSVAIREVFKENNELAWCGMADAQSLANKILELKGNSALREKLAENGYGFYQKNFCPQALGRDLKNILSQLVKSD